MFDVVIPVVIALLISFLGWVHHRNAERVKRRKALLAEIEAVRSSLDITKQSLPIWQRSLSNLKQAVAAYADTLSDRSGLDAAWQRYQNADQQKFKGQNIVGPNGHTTIHDDGFHLMVSLLDELKKGGA